MYKISVIVVENNIKKNHFKTIDSIINQTLKDIEIIYVSKSSNNDEKELIEYMSKYNIVEKKKINEAINIVTGEYTVIADSNVFFEKNWAQKVYDYGKIDNQDIIISDLDIKDDKENKIKSYTFENIEEDRNRIAFLNWNLCNLLFKTEKIKKLQFKDNNIYSELLFILEALLTCEKIGYAQETKCHLYKRKSDLNNIEIKDVEELKYVLKEAKKLYKTNNKYNEENKNILSAIAFSKLGVETLLKLSNKQDPNINMEELIRKIINYLDINFFEWRNNYILRSRFVQKEYSSIWYANKMYRYGYINLYLKLYKYINKT